MPSPWIIATIALAALCAGLVYVVLASKRKMSRLLADETTRWRSELDQQMLLAGQQNAAWSSHVEDLTVRHDVSLAAERKSNEAELERVRQWVAYGMRWEAASRDVIIGLAEEAGLDGFLATNVCVRATGDQGVFIHQIDHLLVTRQRLMVIEAKNWNGLIFHFEHGAGAGVQKSLERLPALANLNRRTPYVIHVREKSQPTILIAENEPTHQVFRQTMELKRSLRGSGGINDAGYFETCVFYHHPNSILVNELNRVGKTHVVDRQRMKTLLASPHPPPSRSTVPIEALADWAAKHGADLYGLGKHRNTWVSVFPTL